jgi:translation initiation factor IF-1
MTPYQALYGRPPPSLPAYFDGATPVHEVEQTLLHRDELLLQLKQHLATATNRMKQTADKKRRDVSFNEGDMVFLRLQPYRQSSAFKRVHQKLATRFFGPYPIIQKVGNMAYKLQLPEGVHIHYVFHMSLLKKYVGDASDTHTDLPPVSDEGAIILEPEAILDHRWVKQGGKFLAESLVKWKHLLTEEATWEVTESLCHQFPNLNLEDKVPLQERVLISHHEDMREQQNRIPSIVKCSKRQAQD